MTNKVLILASVASMIDQFNISNIHILKEMGYEVHIACNFKVGNTCNDERILLLKNRLMNMKVDYYQIDFMRSITKISDNLKAYKQVLDLVNKHDYKFIHCHSPIGGVIGRIIGRLTNTKIIYTAHGFHFYKGAPLLNWVIYYPIELWLSRFTDILITINKEDFRLASDKFKAKKIVYVPGVGIDTIKFRSLSINISEKRELLGVPKNSFILLSVGELNKNKNHEVIIRSLKILNNPKIHYLICGQGNLKEYLIKISNKLGLQDHVHFLGFRDDISEICKASDIFLFPSLREGLGLAALEAMASGLPLITSNVHGIMDYSINGVTGLIANPKDVKEFSYAINKLLNDQRLRDKIGINNIKTAEMFDSKIINIKMFEIYKEEFN